MVEAVAQVRITGYQSGLRKVEMTKTIRLHSGLNLAAAKSCTDSVLDGKVTTVGTLSSKDAQMLAAELLSLGAFADVVE